MGEWDNGTYRDHILVAKFSGEYRIGSGGAPDAALICGITRTALQLWHPAGLIMDLRALSYKWGDEMDWVLSPANDGSELPTAVVGSDKCLPAIGTLVHGIDSTTPAIAREGIFDQFPSAWDYVCRLAQTKHDQWRKMYGDIISQD